MHIILKNYLLIGFKLVNIHADYIKESHTNRV